MDDGKEEQRDRRIGGVGLFVAFLLIKFNFFT
jgi:hypothetical protein